MRVAVIGAGVAGSFCASAIRRLNPAAEIAVFEMGRGAGGRMASRGSRNPELAGMRITHGTPAFTASDPAFAAALSPLLAPAKGVVREWSEVKLGLVRRGDAGAVETTAVQGPTLYRDVGGMCRTLLEEARVDCKFSTKLEGVSRVGDSWTLSTTNGVFEGYDKLVVTSHSAGHPRWREVFKTEPPLASLLDLGDADVTEAMEGLATVESVPVYTVLLAYRATEEAVAVLGGWPFDLAHVEDHPVLHKVVRCLPNVDGGDGDFITLVIHSTADWARRHPSVSGSKSSIADYVKPGAPNAEQDATAELMAAFTELVGPSMPRLEGLTPAYGPQLHRWGSAFSGAGFASKLVCPSVGLGFAGDFALPDKLGSVEGAALSGIRVGEALCKL